MTPRRRAGLIAAAASIVAESFAIARLGIPARGQSRRPMPELLTRRERRLAGECLDIRIP